MSIVQLQGSGTSGRLAIVWLQPAPCAVVLFVVTFFVTEVTVLCVGTNSHCSTLEYTTQNLYSSDMSSFTTSTINLL